MKQQFKLLSAVGLMVILLTATVFTAPVKAAAPTITDVNPKVIVNDVNNALTIDGSDFTDQAQVNVGSRISGSDFLQPYTTDHPGSGGF